MPRMLADKGCGRFSLLGTSLWMEDDIQIQGTLTA